MERYEQNKAGLESHEAEPSNTLARLIIVRHFPSHYQEDKVPQVEHYDLVSTPERKAKNRSRARQIAKIFGEKDIVAVWSSPSARAQGTAEIIKKEIRQPIIKEKIIFSLRNLKIPPDQYESFLQENMSGGWFPKYQETPAEGKAGTTRVESVEEVAKRFKRVFRAFNRFAHGSILENDKKEITNIIAVTHGEIPNDFLESVFGFGYSHHGDYPKQEIGRGESLIVEARLAQDGSFYYFTKMRGKTVEFDFDSRTNKFITKEDAKENVAKTPY